MACQQLEITEVFVHPLITVDYIDKRGESREYTGICNDCCRPQYAVKPQYAEGRI
jgi:hypothetical protein